MQFHKQYCFFITTIRWLMIKEKINQIQPTLKRIFWYKCPKLYYYYYYYCY
jgi:hypothetical protein